MKAHPGWTGLFEGWRRGGLLRDLNPEELVDILGSPPSAERVARVLARHYGVDGTLEPVEREWRLQGDRFLDLPDTLLAPEELEPALRPVLNGDRLDVRHTCDGTELRLVPEPLDAAPLQCLRVRRVRQHARRGVLASLEPIREPARAWVRGLNTLLGARGDARRFVPLAAVRGRLAWTLTTLPRAEHLAASYALAHDERWLEYCAFHLAPRVSQTG
jgi:hypothetical protein